MPAKNGATQRVLAFLRAHPGANAAEIRAGCGVDPKSGLIAWLRTSGMIFVAGPRHWQRYYLDREEAERNHERICVEARESVKHRERVEHRRGALKRRALRQAAGARLADTRRADCCHIVVEPGLVLSPQVRITVAPPLRGRYEPEPGFERVITADYMLRRQGVQS